MPANTSPIFELTPIAAGQQFANADSTNKKTIVTGGANGTRVDGIFISSNDTVAVNLAFYINDGAIDFYIGNVNVPIGSGYTTVVRVDAISTLAPLLGYLFLPNGYILKANCVAAMTAAKILDCLAVGGAY